MSRAGVEVLSIPYARCKQELAAFRNKNRGTERSAAYFDWRYVQRPSGIEPVIVWAIEKASGRPAGSISLIPQEYSVDGRPSFFGVLGDVSVASEMRGRGIAGQMLEHLSQLKEVSAFAACIALPNEEASGPLRKSNWRTMSCLERHVKHLDVRGAFAKKAGGLAASLASPAVNLMLRLFREPSVKLPSSYETTLLSSFDGRFDELWARLPKEGLIAGKRDSAYLSWRFSAHPLEKFSAFLLSEKGRPSGYIVYRADADALKVFDLMCPAGGREPDYLLAAFLDLARESKAASVMIRASRDAVRGFDLRKFGFMKRPDAQSLMVRAQESGAPCGNWHITAADKDV